jgi:hypothetical protein
MAVEDSFILFVLEHGLKVCSLLEISVRSNKHKNLERHVSIYFTSYAMTNSYNPRTIPYKIWRASYI